MKTLIQLSYSLMIIISATIYCAGQGSISPTNPTVCVNGTIQLTFSGPSSATTGYTWTVPPSATILSGQGTLVITAKFTSLTPGQVVQVVGNGIGTATGISVTPPAGAPGTISGAPSVCPGSTVPYTIATPIANASQTIWLFTNNGTVVSQSTTGTVTFSPTFTTTGSVVVYGVTNNCGAGPSSTLTVSAVGRGLPPAATAIVGSPTVTPGAIGLNYSMSVPNISSYQWTLPPGVSLASGGGSSSIYVNVSSSFVSGSISVACISSSGCPGTPSSMTLTASTLPGSASLGGSSFACVDQTGVASGTYNVQPITNATGYVWTVTGGTIISGQNTTSVNVQFNPALSSGSVSVYGTNSIGSGPASTTNVQIFQRAGNAGLISGASNVCPGSVGVPYSIPTIANATSYAWVLPTGATLKTGSNTNSITVDYASTFQGGTINVFGVGGPCGPSGSSTLVIKTQTTPPTPGSISGNASVCMGEQTKVYSIQPISGVADYLWTVPTGVTIASGQGTNSITVNFATTYTVPSAITVRGVNFCGSAPPSILTVVPNSSVPPVVATNSDPNPIWTESTVSPGLSVNVSGASPSYQWRKNGVSIAGATTNPLQFSSAQISYEGVYDVVVSSGSCSTISPPFTVTVRIQGSMNYIISRTILKDNQFKEAEVGGLPVESAQTTIQYFDYLGRPQQNVAWQQSPLHHDVVQPIVYDDLGREQFKYLPTVSTESNAVFKSISFDPTTHDYTTNFYRDLTSTVAYDTRPFSENTFENSPLNRVLTTAGPGQNWKNASKVVTYNSITNDYGTGANQEKIISWKIDFSTFLPIRNLTTMSPSVAGYYPRGSLSISSTKDEQGNEVREYKDLSGHIILKKVCTIGTTTDFNTAGNWTETYYVYDDFKNLSYVFQPELSKVLAASTTVNPSQAQLNSLAFQYLYDQRHRMIKKVVPGADPVYMVYDNRDRIVLTQSGNERKDAAGNVKTDWLFTKYDELDRPIMTGIYTHSATADQGYMTSLISRTNFYDTYVGDIYSGTGYTNNVFPTQNIKILTVTYYDRYDFKSLINDVNYNYLNSEITEVNASLGKDKQELVEYPRINGLVTGTKVNVLGTSTYLWKVNYYDVKKRIIQSIEGNYVGGLDRITNRYDFSSLRETKTSHSSSVGTHSVYRRFVYDQALRVSQVWHKVDNLTEIQLANNQYNELGQLVDKKLHSTLASASDNKQSIDYRYNIRGWLTSMNNSQLVKNTTNNDDINDYFGMNLLYEQNDTNLGNAGLYNGNISGMKWSTKLGLSDISETGYNFTYDALDRLLNANSRMNNKNNWTAGYYSENNLIYDLNGNITQLQRTGNDTGVQIDNLAYTYSGNQLQYVKDNTSNVTDRLKGFTDGNPGTGTDYSYDTNGNMTHDLNKGIGTSTNDLASIITYNYLNLPETITKSGNVIKYVYDATGRKLSQQMNTTQKKTDYDGEFVYENDLLQFINHDEGRVAMSATKVIYSNSFSSASNITSSDVTTNNTTVTVPAVSNGESYMQVTSSIATGGNGATIGGTLTVTPGNKYRIRLKGYRTTNAVYLQIKTGSVISSVALPVNSTLEGWVEQVVTIPAGATTMTINVVWSGVTLNENFYVNEVEVSQLTTQSAEYQYNLKDHLGNVRLTFTTKPITPQQFTAGFETVNQATESANFQHYPSSGGQLNTNSKGKSGANSQLLNGGYLGQVGITKTFAVMPGDQLQIQGYANYVTPDPNAGHADYGTMVASLLTAFNLPTPVASDIGTPSTGVTSFGNWEIGPTGDESKNDPVKIFVTIILFDKNYKFLDASYNASPGSGALMTASYTVKEPGYAYLYVSNEHPTFVDAYIDDVTITYTPGPIIASNDYYPFGLTYNSYSRENSVKQDYQYNGKELQDELNLGWLDFGARMYQPEIARWNGLDKSAENYVNQSSYHYAGNNPVIFVDYNGNDYGVSVNHDAKTITIQAHFLVSQGNKVAFDSRGAAPWNNQNGKNVFITGGIKALKSGKAEVYTINVSVTSEEFGGADGQGRQKSDRDQAVTKDETGTLNSFDTETEGFTQGSSSEVQEGGTYSDQVDVKGSANTITTTHEVSHAMGVDHQSNGGNLPKSGAAVGKGYLAESLRGVGIGGNTKDRNNKSGVGDGKLLGNSSNAGLEKGKVISQARYERIMKRIAKRKDEE